MLTFAQALEKAQMYTPQPGWSELERAEMNEFVEQASPEERAALRNIIVAKNRDLLTDAERFIEAVENEIGMKVPL
jgi:hypothetical protein